MAGNWQAYQCRSTQSSNARQLIQLVLLFRQRNHEQDLISYCLERKLLPRLPYHVC